MVINTNISAQTSARLLGESSSALAKSLARLSSGSKIVSPEDDAAGLAVATRFDAQINRITAANNNVGNAISLNQTQDGFLQKVTKALDRMSELSIMSQDVTKTDADRALYEKQYGIAINRFVNEGEELRDLAAVQVSGFMSACAAVASAAKEELMSRYAAASFWAPLSLLFSSACGWASICMSWLIIVV